jgi:hypothetical protein
VLQMKDGRILNGLAPDDKGRGHSTEEASHG